LPSPRWTVLIAPDSSYSTYDLDDHRVSLAAQNVLVAPEPETPEDPEGSNGGGGGVVYPAQLLVGMGGYSDAGENVDVSSPSNSTSSSLTGSTIGALTRPQPSQPGYRGGHQMVMECSAQVFNRQSGFLGKSFILLFYRLSTFLADGMASRTWETFGAITYQVLNGH
jgi:hypothetical protein